MHWLRIILIVALPLHSIEATAGKNEKCGPYDGVDLTDDPVLLEKILSAHKEWLGDREQHDNDPRRANLCKANLSNADLRHAELREADLRHADLSHADLSHADLSKADLGQANLREAKLKFADLSESALVRSDLSGARLIMTDLTDSKAIGAIFSGARYQPTSTPSKNYVSNIKGISEVRFSKGNQGGLVQLRTVFRDAGLRDLEREVTYAIEKGKTEHASPLEKSLKLIFFEWTSGYGLNYGRPLRILLVLLFPFAFIYYFPIAGQGTRRLYKVWSVERIDDDDPTSNPERRIEPLVINSKIMRILFAVYFSLLSAFHIGWRDLNVGNWIARIQPSEYSLRAKGWVRTVSGIQSLISIYLLALFVLTFFGRPFQ